MATTPKLVGPADPALIKSFETQTPSVARTSPPTVSRTGNATSTGGTISRGIAPRTSGDTTTYNQATQASSGTELFIVSSNNNDSTDVVTVYNTQKDISVSAINQTFNNYKVTNTNSYGNSNVADFLTTYDGNLSSGNLSVIGVTNLGDVSNVHIDGGTGGQVLSTNGSGALVWSNVSSGPSLGNITINGDNVSSTNDIVNIVGDNYVQLQSSNTYMWVEDGEADIEVNGNRWIFNDSGYMQIPNDGSFGALNSSILAFSSQNNKPIFIEVVDTGSSEARQWIFDNAGNLTLPDGTVIQNGGGIEYPTSPGYEWDLHSSDGNVFIGSVEDMAYIDTYSPNIGVRLRTTGTDQNDWLFGSNGNLTLPDIANPSINYANGDPYGGGAGPVTPTANGTFTTLPDFLEFVGGTYLRTGQTSEGVFFDGDAGDPEISYPVRSNFSINGTTKVTVTVDMVVNDECSDFGLCIFEEDIQPEWAWDPNPTRIAASYNCTQPYIYTLNDEIGASWDIPDGGTYRVRFTYDPNNSPNMTLDTLDTSNNVLNSISIDGTLNTSINYYIGFAADQDATNLRTYIQNLNIDIDGGDTYTDSLQLSGGGNANTGNVTFDNINVIGTGNLHLQPDPANSGSYLDIFLTSGPDLHLVASASANLILGKDLGANVMTSWDGNAYIQAWDGSNASIWTFSQDGSTIFPTLTVQRGDNPSGTITGQTLSFGDPSQEAIISTADGTANNEYSQRLVINPGKGYDYGEGGDIYLWAGRGGDGSGSGGDIKIRGGQGGANTTGGSGGDGGYIRIEAGDSATTGGAPGYIDINGGINYLGVGGYVDIRGGQGHTIGGDANITGGYGYDDRGGNVNIWGGGSANGQINEGNVNIQTGGNTWTFDPSGNLTLPNGTKFGTPEGSGTTGIVAPIETAFLIETNSLPTDPPTTMVISGADFVAVNLTYTRDFGQPTPTWYPAGYTPGVDPYIEFSAIHNNQYEINVPGFPQALYVNGGTLNIPLAQWAINPPFGSEAPTGVYTYPSNYIYSWSFGVDRALYFPEGSSLGGSLASNEFALFNNVNTNFAIYTNDGNSHQWNFGADGVISVDGNLKLAPDSNNAGSYLDIFLTNGPDLHLVASAGANLILGKDDGANVMTSWNGNVYIQSWTRDFPTHVGGIWTFGGDGNLTLPADATIKNNAELSYGGGVTIQVSDLANAVVESPGTLVGNTYNNTGFTQIIFTDSTLYNALVTAGIAPETIVATTWSNGSTTQLNTYVYVQFPGSPDTFSLRPCDANGNTIVGDWVFPSVVGTTIPANVAITSVGTSTFHTWNFISDGNLTVPGPIVGAGYSRLDMITDGPNTAYLGTTNNDTTALYLQKDTVQMYANTDVYITANVGGTGQGWTFGADGNLTLPTTVLDVGLTENTKIRSQRKIIPPYHWSAIINSAFPDPTVVYTATSSAITSMKVTVQVQHSGFRIEMFDVSATYTGSDTYYSVSNRLKPPTITDTTVLVDLNGSGVMQITLTINSGAKPAWITYDATEFGIPQD